MPKNYWLVKQEPEAYAWDTFEREGSTVWDGVRNFQARANLRAMRVGDEVLFYASVTTKAILGLAVVEREAFPDPTAGPGEEWSAVTLRCLRRLPSPVTLESIKADPVLRDIPLVRQSRLSVMPLTPAVFRRLAG
jgi:predicted RNA-binding protein with PUA-like domain